MYLMDGPFIEVLKQFRVDTFGSFAFLRAVL